MIHTYLLFRFTTGEQFNIATQEITMFEVYGVLCNSGEIFLIAHDVAAPSKY